MQFSAPRLLEIDMDKLSGTDMATGHPLGRVALCRVMVTPEEYSRAVRALTKRGAWVGIEPISLEKGAILEFRAGMGLFSAIQKAIETAG
jgi:hypothetical protein